MSYMVDGLLKYLKEDTTISIESLQEATHKGFKTKESVLPTDPSKVENPKEDIQKLSEEKDKKETTEIEPAEIKEDPKLSTVEKEANKETPDVDKLADPEVAAKIVKDGKEKVEVTGLEEPKEKKQNECKNCGCNKSKIKESLPDEDKIEMLSKELDLDKATIVRIAQELGEGKVPADASIVDGTKDVQNLSEEKVLTTVSDPKVAEDLKSKYPGSHIVKDKDEKGNDTYIVMIKEEKKIKEDVEINVKVDGKEINIVDVPEGGMQVTTVDTASNEAEPDFDFQEGDEEQPDMSDEEMEEVVERIVLSEAISKQKKSTKKEKKFVEDTKKLKDKKYSKKNKSGMAAKMQALRAKRK